MVGDTDLDMDAAHATETERMGVLCGYGPQNALEPCADHLFKNASEAITRILKGWKNPLQKPLLREGALQ